MGEARRRAPRREGTRTTLRVPEPLLRAAEQLAAELGTTANDALVQLAETGAADADRRRRAEQLAAQRRDAVAKVGLADALDFPSPAELGAAMRSGRSES